MCGTLAHCEIYTKKTTTRHSSESSFQSEGWKMGFEPTTFGTTIRHSNQLSYIHHTVRSSLRTDCKGNILFPFRKILRHFFLLRMPALQYPGPISHRFDAGKHDYRPIAARIVSAEGACASTDELYSRTASISKPDLAMRSRITRAARIDFCSYGRNAPIISLIRSIRM